MRRLQRCGYPQARRLGLAEGLTGEQARAVGRLAGTARHDDTIDVAVVEGAVRRSDAVVTSDPDDLERVAAAVGETLRLVVV